MAKSEEKISNFRLPICSIAPEFSENLLCNYFVGISIQMNIII